MGNELTYYRSVERFAGSLLTRDGVSRYPVTDIVGSLKKHTALEGNKILHRSGAFWQHESYDHVVRNYRELERIIWYILNNPVKAGFVKDWREWKWSYCRYHLSCSPQIPKFRTETQFD